MSSGLEFLLVSKQIRKKHTAVRTDLAARENSLIEQLHQVRAGYIQEVGRLLSCQFSAGSA